MSEQQVILDDKSFKALSADSRVNILKSLKERRMTLTELSKRLSLESSTVKEHCSVLVGADLIHQIDDGHKWKYYELTGKGKNIIMPNLFEQVRVLVVLCLGAVLFSGLLFGLISVFSGVGSTSNTSLAQSYDAPLMKSTIAGANDQTTLAATALETTQARETNIQEITREFFIFSTTIALISGILIGWIGARKAI